MKIIKAVAVLFVLVLASGCADTVTFSQAAAINPVGFWYGLWHGMILPFAWIGSLFTDSISIYAIYNSGGWYDFGFFLGVGTLSGSATTTSKNTRIGRH